MIEFIVLALFGLSTLGFGVFIYLQSQKQAEMLQKQMKEFSQMAMAGSLQEYQRVKLGKRPIPNKLKNKKNFEDLTEANRIPWEDITGVKVDEGAKTKVKLYS
jgi:hypothetical protein